MNSVSLKNYYYKYKPIYDPYVWHQYVGIQEDVEINRYIINDGATIIFWNDGTKTISKRDQDDKFDKELGFLFAYFQKKWSYSRNTRKKVLSCIKENQIKEFLFEFYVKDSKQSKEKARKYLSNLVIEK